MSKQDKATANHCSYSTHSSSYTYVDHFQFRSFLRLHFACIFVYGLMEVWMMIRVQGAITQLICKFVYELAQFSWSSLQSHTVFVHTYAWVWTGMQLREQKQFSIPGFLFLWLFPSKYTGNREELCSLGQIVVDTRVYEAENMMYVWLVGTEIDWLTQKAKPIKALSSPAQRWLCSVILYFSSCCHHLPYYLGPVKR